MGTRSTTFHTHIPKRFEKRLVFGFCFPRHERKGTRPSRRPFAKTSSRRTSTAFVWRRAWVSSSRALRFGDPCIQTFV
jgi:hypothetical protein